MNKLSKLYLWVFICEKGEEILNKEDRLVILKYQVKEWVNEVASTKYQKDVKIY